MTDLLALLVAGDAASCAVARDYAEERGLAVPVGMVHEYRVLAGCPLGGGFGVGCSGFSDGEGCGAGNGYGSSDGNGNGASHEADEGGGLGCGLEHGYSSGDGIYDDL